jgi:hypothetical protein
LGLLDDSWAAVRGEIRLCKGVLRRCMRPLARLRSVLVAHLVLTLLPLHTFAAAPRFLPWPEDALTSVSGKFIDEFSMACPKEVKNLLKLLMGHTHVFVTNACKEYFEKYRRYVYVTPKSYLSFLQGYKELYARKWSFTKELAYQIEAGLQKMFEAKADVNKMKAELAVKNQDLAVSAKEAEALLKQISESTAIAEKEKQKVAVIVDAVSLCVWSEGAAVACCCGRLIRLLLPTSLLS